VKGGFDGFTALMAGCPDALEVEVLSSTPPVALLVGMVRGSVEALEIVHGHTVV